MPRRTARRRPDESAPDRAQAILAVALEQAERVGWDSVRLNRVAAALGLTLADLRGCYRDADAIAEAWLDRADQAMLAPPDPEFARLEPAARVERALLRWLDALAPHRRVTRQILLGKLYPGHPHHVAALITRLSRTVQWLREAALLDAPPPRRQVEEIALTWLLIATVAVWAADASSGQAVTRRFLAGRLRHAARASEMLRARRAPVGPPRRGRAAR